MALTTIEFAQKAKDGTLTVEEAIAFAENEPGVSSSARKRIRALRSGFKKMGLETSMLYKDLKDKEVLQLFTREFSPDKSNRAGNLQALEGVIRPVFDDYAIGGLTEEVGEGLAKTMYPVLTGKGTVAGTQRTGLALERPMQGLLPQEDFVKIYEEALPEIEAKYGSATADLIAYHARTANRPEQLQGLKKSQIKISGNTITVPGKKVTNTDKKGRPELTFDLDSPMGQLLKRNMDSSKSEFLFDVTDQQFSDAFNNHVGTRLEAFSDLLPLQDTKVKNPDGTVRIVQQPVTTPSAVRSIVPKFMLDQHNVPDGLVQGIMGHVNKTVLRKNYAGISPSTDLPKLLESPQTFAVGDFGTNQKNINLDLLSDEDKARLAEEQKLTLIEEDKRRRTEASAAIAQAEAAEVKARASITPEEIARASAVDEELERAKAQRRIRQREIYDEEKAKRVSSDDAVPQPNPEARARLEGRGFNAKGLADAINKHLGKAVKTVADKTPGPVKKALGPIGLGLTSVVAQGTYQEVQAATGSRTLATLAGASEFAPIGYSDIKDIAAARSAPDTFGMTPAGRIAAEQEAGFIDLETNREPEAAPAPEAGFITR